MGIERGGERCRNGVVGIIGLGDEALVADDGGAHERLLDIPLADVRLAAGRVFLVALLGDQRSVQSGVNCATNASLASVGCHAT
jgi:hypothetical protein